MRKLVTVILMLCGMAVSVFAGENGKDGLGGYVGVVSASNHIEGVAPGVYAHIAQRADQFLVNGHRTVYAAELLNRINAGERLFLLDIRLNKDYLAGHIPGAVNIEFANVAKPENLTVLPTDGTPIVVICYTGHTASQTNAILNLLGYNAWVLRFGMTSWRSATDTKVWSPDSTQAITGADYTMETE